MKHNHRLLNRAMLLLAISMFFCGFSAFAQKVKPDDVPQAVKSTFTTEFPNAKVKDWQIKGDQYLVSYKDDGTSQTTLFSNTGTLIETRTPIDKQELPGSIVDYISSEYPGFDIGVSELVQKPKTKDIYDVTVKKSGVGTGNVSVLSFASDGKLISRKDPEGFVAAKKEEPKKEVVKTTKKETTVGEVEEKTKTKEKTAKSKNGDYEDNKSKSKAKKDNYPENIISENSVPPIVKKNFVKKFPKADEVKWFNRKGDSIYTIKCIFREQKNEIAYTASGKWLTQKLEQDEKTLFPAVLKYLDKTYRKYQFVSSIKTVTFDKKDGYEVKIIELKNKKKKLETTIFFDKMGKLIKTVDPEYTYEETTEKQTAADRKLEEDFAQNATNVEDDNNSGLKVQEKELPSELTSYVYANYPGMKIKSSYLKEIDDLGKCYEVSIAREGINQETIVLIFDKLGKFIKNANDEGGESTEKSEAPKVYTPAEAVVNAFKTKYPKVTKVTWEEGADNDFIASYSDGTGAHKSFFTADGAWTKMSTNINVESVPANIKTYVEKNYKGYKIMAGRNVKKVDKKTYYEVDIQHKKTNDTQTIEFNQAGKPTADSGSK